LILRRVKIGNFRSIGRDPLDIKLKPLTILVGPNASGKSSILFAIDFFAKRGQGGYIHTNPNEYEKLAYDVHTIDDYIFGRNLSTANLLIEFEFKLPDELNEKITEYLDLVDWQNLGIDTPNLRYFNYGFKWRYAPEAKEFGLSPEFGYFEVHIKIGKKHPKALEIKTSQSFNLKEKRYERILTGLPKFAGVRTVNGGTPLMLFSEKPFMVYGDLVSEDRKLLSGLEKFLKIFLGSVSKELLSHFYLLTGSRGWMPLKSKAEPCWDVGVRGEKTVEASATILGSYDIGIKQKLGEWAKAWLHRFGLDEYSAGLSPDERNATRATFKDSIGVRLDLASASYGCRQVASMITQLIITPKQSVIMIEEPEISLHPEAQTLLPLLLADVIKKHEKQIIVTTHSSFFTLSLMDAVSGRDEYPEVPRLNINDIAIYHIHRDAKKNNQTVAELIRLTPEGLPRAGIPSFTDVEERLLKRMSNKLSSKGE
jgi:predicted ATPase